EGSASIDSSRNVLRSTGASDPTSITMSVSFAVRIFVGRVLLDPPGLHHILDLGRAGRYLTLRRVQKDPAYSCGGGYGCASLPCRAGDVGCHRRNPGPDADGR